MNRTNFPEFSLSEDLIISNLDGEKISFCLRFVRKTCLYFIQDLGRKALIILGNCVSDYPKFFVHSVLIKNT